MLVTAARRHFFVWRVLLEVSRSITTTNETMRRDGNRRTRVATHNGAAGQLLRHTPVKHPGRVEASRVWQSVTKGIHLASDHVIVVTLVYRRHSRTYRSTHQLQALYHRENNSLLLTFIDYNWLIN